MAAVTADDAAEPCPIFSYAVRAASVDTLAAVWISLVNLADDMAGSPVTTEVADVLYAAAAALRSELAQR